MPNAKSRVQNTRESRTEDWIALVISTLNSERLKGGTREVFGHFIDPRPLMLLVKRLQAIEVRIPISRAEGKWKKLPDPELVRLTSSINRVLSRYTAQPSLARVEPTALRDWPINWVPVGAKKNRYLELRLLLEIVGIAQAGRISALKQCAQCHKWMFGRFSHQRFCSEDCKEQFHRSNEGDKRRRRDWARKNYWNHKVLDLGTKNVKRGK